MKNTIGIGLCIIGMVACSSSNSSHSDAAAMQGSWSGTETGAGPNGSGSMVITGTNLEYHSSDSNEWYKASFVLDPDATPRKITVLITDCPAPPFVGKTANGIYQLADGALTITACAPGDPSMPTNFGAPNARTLVFKNK